jgi:DNA repair protein RadD
LRRWATAAHGYPRGDRVELRPDQSRSIAMVHDARVRGGRAVLMVAPTGYGKTVTLSEIARRSVGKGRRVAWYAHRRELIDQAARTLQGFGLEVGHGATGRTAPVQIRSVQGSGDAVPAADLVILDEAHHYVAAQWGRLPDAYPDATIVGATATPERGDGEGLRSIFSALVVCAQVSDMQRAGVLVPCEVKRPRRQLRPDQIAKRPVDAYLAHARGERAVLFCRTVDDAVLFSGECRLLGVRSDVVHEGLKPDVRDGVLRRFASGELDVVANVAILTEGWDCPPCSVCILARGCGSAGLLIQMAGRTLRASPGKTRAVLLDLRGVTHALGAPDEDREFSLDGNGIRRCGPAGQVRLCPVCGTILAEDGCTYCLRATKGPTPLTVANEPLFDWKAERRANDSGDKRAESLAKWIRVAEDNAKNPRIALHKFNAVYGSYPSEKTVAESRRMLREYRDTVQRISESRGPLFGGD